MKSGPVQALLRPYHSDRSDSSIYVTLQMSPKRPLITRVYCLQFPMYTLLAFDAQHNGIPVAWFVTGSKTAENLKSKRSVNLSASLLSSFQDVRDKKQTFSHRAYLRKMTKLHSKQSSTLVFANTSGSSIAQTIYKVDSQ